MNDEKPEEIRAKSTIPLVKFFENVAPGSFATVSGIPLAVPYNPIGPAPPPTPFPQLKLHCGLKRCDGERIFEAEYTLPIERDRQSHHFITYVCNNCRITRKVYAIWILPAEADGVAEMFKLGEHPAFAVTLPSKLISMIGPERDYLLKGRRAESQGLGIGAFAYYRRVIESQKTRIIDEMIRAAERLSASKDVLEELRQAKSEDRFIESLKAVKHALPQGLQINGRSPLELLHSALSEGLHELSDEDCLSRATNIRLVMVALAERLSSALEDNVELDKAVAELVRKKAARKSTGKR
jgi:hypothetical protein